MKTFFSYLVLVFLLHVVFCNNGFSAIDYTVPEPSFKEVLKCSDRQISNLKKLLDDGNLTKFYQIANDVLEEWYTENENGICLQTEKDVKIALWLRFLIASAPLIDIESDQQLEWLMKYSDLDYQVKQNVILTIPFDPLSNKKVFKQYHFKQDEAVSLFIASEVMILKQLKSAFDPDFKKNYKYWQQKAQSNMKLLNDQKSAAMFFNRLEIFKRRNVSIQVYIEYLENSLVDLLIGCYPTKGIEVKKYLHLAGYADSEMPGLLDRTVGRVGKASYLYKGLPKKRL